MYDDISIMMDFEDYVSFFYLNNIPIIFVPLLLIQLCDEFYDKSSIRDKNGSLGCNSRKTPLNY